MNQHAEAFCLMWYACRCGHRERIWNSRDGVTPFVLQCPSCGDTTLHHVDWKSDLRAPEWKPRPGQRFFRDVTNIEAEAIVERRLKMFADAGLPADSKTRKALLRDARTLTGEWQRGWPTVIRTPD